MKSKAPFVPTSRGANTLRRVRLLVVENREWVDYLLGRFPNLQVVRCCMVGDTFTWMNYLANNAFDYAVYPRRTNQGSNAPGIIHRIQQAGNLQPNASVTFLMGHISLSGLHDEMSRCDQLMQPITDADEYADAFQVLRAKAKTPVVSI